MILLPCNHSSSFFAKLEVMSDQDLRENLIARLKQKYPAQLIKQKLAEHGSPLYLMSLDDVRAKYNALKQELPGVKHHYAIKCLPINEVVAAINKLDGYFDVATTGEIDLALSQGVRPEQMTHTHPMARRQDIAEALERGVKRFVFDSPSQIPMLKSFNGQAEFMLRIAVPNESAQINLSAKFGLDPLWAESCLEKAKQSGVDVVGVSFHAGSQMPSSNKMVEGIRVAHKIFQAAGEIGYQFKVLDIGGGFPAHYTKHIDELAEFCTPVRQILQELFPDIEVMSEPGRGIVADAAVSVSSVMGTAIRGGIPWYYLDDGAYGAYSGILFEHGDYPIVTMKEVENPDIAKTVAVLAGPTCDSVDVIAQEIELPELETGDVVLGLNMGAYSIATTTDFNFFPRAKVIFVD